MKALILAAGYGTRLYPLTKDIPKPLLPIGDEPIINYIMAKLQRLKTTEEIFVVTNRRFFRLFCDWKKKVSFKKRFDLINDGTTSEEERLGAIGDIDFAIKNKGINTDLLIIGGDNLFDWSLDKFVNFAKSKLPAFTIGVYDIEDKSLARKFGVVRMDEDGKIVNFQEKPRFVHSSLISMCLYYFPKTKLSLTSKYLKMGKDRKDEVGAFIGWLCKGEEVYGFKFSNHWYDIGDREELKKAGARYGSEEILRQFRVGHRRSSR